MQVQFCLHRLFKGRLFSGDALQNDGSGANPNIKMKRLQQAAAFSR
jgi:hypothetical protein